MGKKNNNAAYMNDLTYLDVYKRLHQLAISEFEWKGLPESCNARFLEQTMYFKGVAIFFMDKNKQSPMFGNLIALPATPYGQLNMYHEPIKYTAVSTSYHAYVDAEDCVICRNNYDRLPTDMSIRLFAERLADIQRTIDVNMRAQKTPYVFLCDEKQRLTFERLFDEIDGNHSCIFGSKQMDLASQYKVFLTNAPFIADKAATHYMWQWNQAMSFLGINNANTDKKERMIVDEANSNNQYIDLAASVMLLTRKECAEQCNKKFGTNISVDMRVYSIDGEEQEEAPDEKDGEKDE